jgi:hypothetical protein
MSCLPKHGRIDCSACFKTSSPIFNKTQQSDGNWRITANPLAWGNPEAEIVVLGFSKGPNAVGASLANQLHNEIAYSGKRPRVGKIRAHIGLLEKGDDTALKNAVDKAIADEKGRFHFGSFIRCGVERNDPKKGWVSSSGGILDKFVATSFGKMVSEECSSQFLGNLPPQTKLIIMFGMGTKQKYVREAYKIFQHIKPGNWRWLINDVSYTDGKITVVHVEHFSVQGPLLRQWLGEIEHKRSKYGNAARISVEHALGK